MGYTIVHTTCHTQYGGLEKRIFNESRWMARQGHTVVIAAPPDTPLWNKARENGFQTPAVHFKRSGLFHDFRKLRRLFQQIRPHILNTHGNEDAKIALAAALGTGIPLRILSRHISAHVRNSWYNRLLYRRLCRYVFTTADYTTRHLIETLGLAEDRVHTVSSGIVPPERLMDPDEARKRLAGEVGAPPDARFLGFVGRVSADKGVDTLIRAFHRVSNRIPHHLALVGGVTEDYRTILEKLAAGLGVERRVHFTGFRENVWPFYRGLDAMILASRDLNGIPFEGIPQSVLEAMYARCPVIGSKSGGIPDVVRHGRTGLIFRPGDDPNLAETIMQVLSDPTGARARAEDAFRMVAAHHTLDAMGNRILDLVRRALDETARTH